MIRENQTILNRLNVLSDAVIVYLSLPLAFVLYFNILKIGVAGIPLQSYLLLGFALTFVIVFTCAAFGLYRSYRHVSIARELWMLFLALTVDALILLSLLFLGWEVNYSRMTLALFFAISFGILSLKRILLRKMLYRFRQKGLNQKHILLIGNSMMAKRYLREIRKSREFGYVPIGYVASTPLDDDALPCLGSYDVLGEVLERINPDEAVCAISTEDYGQMPSIIGACEDAGVKLSVIPLFAEFMSGSPYFDALGGIPLWNLRRIPLDNWLNAFVKRTTDLLVSALALLLLSPLLLLCAIGVKLSSPGPVFFRQKRIGRGKKPFHMVKFRSMRVNDREDSGWSGRTDDRRTAFGSFLRKFSLDELPQLWNVLKGDMSLIGPRPEVPHFVEQFRTEIPLYMVKHQVRPGITGWAQVNDLRGDTSIKERIEHDIFYIEHWSFGFDLKILFMTVFGGKFVNDEKL